MVMTIDVPDKIVRDAKAKGLTVEQQLQQLAAREGEPDLSGLVPWGKTYDTPEAASEARERAAASIREIASRNTLGGISIRELINEGRKY